MTVVLTKTFFHLDKHLVDLLDDGASFFYIDLKYQTHLSVPREFFTQSCRTLQGIQRGSWTLLATCMLAFFRECQNLSQEGFFSSEATKQIFLTFNLHKVELKETIEHTRISFTETRLNKKDLLRPKKL